MKLFVRRWIVIVSAALALAAAAGPAPAQPAVKEELKAQFKAREAPLRELKQQGRIGETIDGYVEVVDAKAPADEKAAALLSDENRDRRRLYAVLADEINMENPKAAVKATIETIAARNARRNIDRAGPTEFLRVAKDHWVRVKDFPRFERLTTLKTQGKVGETAAGLVEVVKDEDRADPAIGNPVREENAARAAEYKALAAKERVDAAVIEKRMSDRNFANARIGDMLRDKDGRWRRK